MSTLLNQSKMRRHLLETAGKTRAHKFTRVSAAVLAEAENLLKNWAEKKIQQHPSSGKTIV